MIALLLMTPRRLRSTFIFALTSIVTALCSCGAPSIAYLSDPLYERIDEGRFARALSIAASAHGYQLLKLEPARDEAAMFGAATAIDTRFFVLSPLLSSFSVSLSASRPGVVIAIADADGLGDPGNLAFHAYSEPFDAIERAGRFMRGYLEANDARGDPPSFAATLLAGSREDVVAREDAVRKAFSGEYGKRLRTFRFDSKESLRLASSELKDLDISIALVDAGAETRSALDAFPEFGVFLCVVIQGAMPPERRGIGLIIEPDRDAQASQAVSAILEGRMGSLRLPMRARLTDWGSSHVGTGLAALFF